MRTRGRPGRFALIGSIALSLGLAGVAAAWTHPAGLGAADVEIPIHYSHYGLGQFTVPAGVPVRIVLKNEDPIDHEWIVGDAALHERHRTGTEPVHDSRPTEVTIPAGATQGNDGDVLDAGHLPVHLPPARPRGLRDGRNGRGDGALTDRPPRASCAGMLVPCDRSRHPTTRSRPASPPRSRWPVRRCSAAGC